MTTNEDVILSEDLYREIFNRIAKPAVILETNGTIFLINEQTIMLFGDHGSKKIGNKIWDLKIFQHSNFSEKIYTELKKQLTQEKNAHFSIKYSLDGFSHVLDCSLNKIFLDERQKYYLWQADEITSLIEVQKKLETSEQYYGSLFNNFKEAIMIVNPHSGFLSGNKATLELFGCKTKEEFIGQTPWSLSPEYQPDGILSSIKAQHMMKKALENGSNFFEWRHKKINGEEFDTTVYLSRLILNEKEQIMHAWVRDISKEKQLEKERNRLLKIIDQAPDFISYSNLARKVVYINPAGKLMAGMKADENLNDVKIEDFHPKWAFDKIANEGIPFAVEHETWEGETALKTKSGEVFPVWQTIMSHKDSRGKIEYISTIIRDLRPQKVLEEERFHNQKSESLSLFAGGIAHDFNNMLTSVLGSLSLLELEMMENTADRDYSLQLIKEAVNATNRAAKLTKQLLSYSKGGTSNPKLIEVFPVVKESANFVQHGSNCIVCYDFEEGLWPIYADELKISQVFHNLVLNAIQAMEAGGKIQIAGRNIILAPNNVQTLKPGKYVQISIEDTGKGISPEQISKIFDPYFSTKQGGTGLGLAICMTIVRNHKGTITVESQLNKGTKFSIYIPAYLK